MCECVCNFLEKAGPRFCSSYVLLPEKPKSPALTVQETSLGLSQIRVFKIPVCPDFPTPTLSFSASSLGLAKSVQPSPFPEQPRRHPFRTHNPCTRAHVLLQSLWEKVLSSLLGKPGVSGREQDKGTRGRGEHAVPRLHTPSWRLPAPLRSFIWRGLSWLIRSKYPFCQIITLFARQLRNLLYQLAGSPAAAIHLCLPRACRAQGLRGSASRAREEPAGSRELSGQAAFSRARQVEGTRGALPRTGERSGSRRARPPPRGRSFPRGRHTCTPDVAREGAPAEPGGSTRRLRSGPGPGSAEENAERELRMPPPLVLTHFVGRAPRSGVSWKGMAGRAASSWGHPCVSDTEKTLAGRACPQGCGSGASFASALSAALLAEEPRPHLVLGSGGVLKLFGIRTPLHS